MAGFGIQMLTGRAPAKPSAEVLMRRAEADASKMNFEIEVRRREVLKNIDIQRQRKIRAAKAQNKKEFANASASLARLEASLAFMQSIESKVEEVNDATANNRLIVSAVSTLKSAKESLEVTASQIKVADVEDVVEAVAEAIAEANELVSIVSAPMGDTVEDYDNNDMDAYLEEAADAERSRAKFEELQAEEVSRQSAAAAAASPPMPIAAAVASTDTEHLRATELLMNSLPVPSATVPTRPKTAAQIARERAFASS